MSWTAIAAAGIGAAGSLIGGVGKGKKARRAAADMNNQNIAFQREVNQQNIDWNTDMWNKTNEYNSPHMQMQRFKAAGLNPHLIYGQGNETSMPSAPNVKAAEVDALPIDTTVNEIGAAAFQAAQTYLANRKQNIEIENMEAARGLTEAQTIATQAGTAGTLANTARTEQQIDHANRLIQNTIDQGLANVRSTEAGISKIEQEIRASKTGQQLSESQIRQNAQSILESQKRIEQMRIQGDNLKLDKEIKELDLKLKRLGIQPSDSYLFRIPTQIMSDPDLRGKAGKAFKNWWSK